MRMLLAATLAASLAAATASQAHAHAADDLPDEMVGRWCQLGSEWDSAAFSMFVQSDCKTGTGFNLTKTTQSYFSGTGPGAVFPNSECTVDRVMKLVDDHYLVNATCKEHGGPDAMHPNRGQPYSGEEILFLETCGRLQSKTPELCNPHCDPEPPPEACRVS